MAVAQRLAGAELKGLVDPQPEITVDKELLPQERQ